MSEALRLAEWLQNIGYSDLPYCQPDYEKAAAELRRLHAENERLREALRNFVDGCSLSIDAAAVAREALK